MFLCGGQGCRPEIDTCGFGTDPRRDTVRVALDRLFPLDEIALEGLEKENMEPKLTAAEKLQADVLAKTFPENRPADAHFDGAGACARRSCTADYASRQGWETRGTRTRVSLRLDDEFLRDVGEEESIEDPAEISRSRSGGVGAAAQAAEQEEPRRVEENRRRARNIEETLARHEERLRLEVVAQYAAEQRFRQEAEVQRVELLRLESKEQEEQNKVYDFCEANGFASVNGRRRRLLRGSACPLHVAVSQNNAEIVRLLLDYNGDPKAKDSRGRTPLQVAQRFSKRGSHSAILSALGAGAEPCKPLMAA